MLGGPSVRRCCSSGLQRQNRKFKHSGCETFTSLAWPRGLWRLRLAGVMLRSTIAAMVASCRSSDWMRHGATYGFILVGMTSVGIAATTYFGPPIDAEAIRAQHRRRVS